MEAFGRPSLGSRLVTTTNLSSAVAQRKSEADQHHLFHRHADAATTAQTQAQAQAQAQVRVQPIASAITRLIICTDVCFTTQLWYTSSYDSRLRETPDPLEATEASHAAHVEPDVCAQRIDKQIRSHSAVSCQVLFSSRSIAA